MRQNVSFLCGAAVSMLAIQAYGFPIEAVTLRELATASDLVAVARVVPAPEPDRKGQPRYPSLLPKSPVALKLSSVLKGASQSNLVYVHFDPRIFCPAPPRFPEDTNMLVYLRERRAGGYQTVALSYGVKVASDQEIKSYSKRIRELLEIQKNRDPKRELAQTVEWLVDCAEDPVTRWDGAIELTDRVTLLEKTNASPFAQYLTASHLARLSNALFKAEFVRYDELALCRVFERREQRAVIDYLIKYLHRVKQPVGTIDTTMMSDSVPEPWAVYDIMHTLARLRNSAAAREFLDRKLRTGFFSYVERTNSICAFLPLVERPTRSAR